MIFLWYKKVYPDFLTWTFMLCFVQASVFFLFFSNPNSSQANIFSDESLSVAGKLMYQVRNPSSEAIPQKSTYDWMDEGWSSLKNPDFLNKLNTEKFYGDTVAIESLKQEATLFQKSLKEDPLSAYGFDYVTPNSFLKLITYQFSHSGIFHLLGNLAFLLILGILIEPMVGGITMMAVFLLSGIGGAFSFLYLSAPTVLPMVGASASVMGLLMFYFVIEKSKTIPLFFAFSPAQGFFGKLYVNKLWLLWLFVIPDIFGIILQSIDVQSTSVAHSAHAGGALVGMVLGVGYQIFAARLKLLVG